MMETKSPSFTFNLSTLLLIFAGFAIVGSWWLDHKRLKEEIIFETENRRIVLHDIQKQRWGFTWLEDDEYVYKLSTTESQLSAQLSAGEPNFLELIYLIGMWEASFLGTVDGDEFVSKYERIQNLLEYNNSIGVGWPRTCSPTTRASSEQRTTQVRRFELGGDKTQVISVEVASEAVASFDQFFEDCGFVTDAKLSQ